MIRFLLKLNYWVIFFTLLSYISPLISPEQMSFLTFVGLAYPWLLLLNCVFVFWWSVSRMRYWWYSAVCILLGWYYTSSVVGLNFGKSNTPSGSVKLMSYNVLSTVYIKKIGFAKFNEFLAKEKCDIICFQEFGYGEGVYKQYEERIATLSGFPHRYYNKENLNSIFSKFPIINANTIRFEPYNGANGGAFADIQINDKIIRFYNIHLNSNRVTSILDTGIDITEEKETIKKVYAMLKKMRLTAFYRANQAKLIKKHIETSPYPVVICGDFNATPVSYPYHLLSENRNEAFQESGVGYAKTYRGKIPALKIDHILLDKSIKTYNTKIEKVSFSDHYPIITELFF